MKKTKVEKRYEKACRFSEINLAIICPMANEMKSAERFVEEVVSTCLTFHFKRIEFFAIVDNVSKDGTKCLLENMSQKIPELNMIYAPENRCIVDAYIRGYKEALNSGADWILEIDAGFSHQPVDIPKFFHKMKEGFKCVFGSRFCTGGHFDDAKKSRYLISRGGTILSNILLGTRLSDMTSGFQLFDANALEKILAETVHSRGPFFQTEMKYHAHKFLIAEVPIRYRSPSHNVGTLALLDSFYNLARLFRHRFYSL